MVDFAKMLADFEQRGLTTFGDVKINPADLQNASVIDFVANGGSGRIPELKIGQSDTEALDGAAAGVVGATGQHQREAQFYTRKRTKDEDIFTGPYPAPLTVIPIAIYDSMTRVFYAGAYDENEPDKEPDCSSFNGMQPEAKYLGQIIPETSLMAHACTTIAPKMRGGKMVTTADGYAVLELKPVCPLAMAGRDKDGGYVKPRCAENYLIYLAIWRADDPEDLESGGEWMLVQSRYKSISIGAGRGVVKSLRDIQKQGGTIWNYALTLTGIKKGKGNSFIPTLSKNELERSPEDQEIFIAFAEQVKDELQYLEDRSLGLLDEDQSVTDTRSDAEPTITDVEDAEPKTEAKTKSKKNLF